MVAREFRAGSGALAGIAAEGTLLDVIDGLRVTLGASRSGEHQAALGQYFTPAPIARFMAGLIPSRPGAHLRLLDAGAGIGVLTAAVVESLRTWPHPPASISVTAYEVDEGLLPILGQTLDLCARYCARAGIPFDADVRRRDFIVDTVDALSLGMFGPESAQYDAVIMNPPYFKIHSQSAERRALRRIGIETSNIYTAFLSLALRLLADGGDFVFITPRSYCNGRYFQAFRRDMLSRTALRRYHLFTRRDTAFRDDEVLQETIIAHVTQGIVQPESIIISESAGADTTYMTAHTVPIERVVHPGDPEHVIHLETKGTDCGSGRMRVLTTRPATLGLTISTGRVVDFRARPWLRAVPGPDTVPLIYPEHCLRGSVVWPKVKSKKSQAIVDSPKTADLLVPAGVYVLVKRFSAKEERRRIVAVVYDPERAGLPGDRTGFENHLNYYHCGGKPLPRTLAWGLAAFLNSTVVDEHFRSWSGSTQVNATDLRRLRYPSLDALCGLGERIGESTPDQAELDHIVDAELFGA